MPRQPNPNSKSSAIIVRANDECDKAIINYFKEVCARDGLEMRKEILNLINFNWKKTHPPPGNPQILLEKFTEQQNLSQLCEIKGCNSLAILLCFSVFPFGKDRKLCNQHKIDEVRKGNVRASKKI